MSLVAHDIQDALLRWTGAQSTEQIITDIREGINDALHELWGKYDWAQYEGQEIMQFEPPYQTGTVTYVAATRQWTLTGGVWPTWAIYGTIRQGSNDARVTKRISDTVIQIEDGTGFLTDIPSATSYTLYRHCYPVPQVIPGSTIRKIAYMYLDQNNYYPIQYVTPLEFRTRRPGSYGAIPLMFTIMKDRAAWSGLTINLWPFPGTRYTTRFNYIRSAAAVALWSESTGTITVTANSTTVNGTNTNFSPDHVGCLLRVGRTNNQVPTSRAGIAPFSEELLIDTVVSSTQLTVTTPVVTSRTNVKYDISSLVDIDDEIMRAAFMQQCYYQLGKRRSYDDKKMAGIERQLMADTKAAISRALPSQEITYAGNFVGPRRYTGTWIPLGFV